MSSWTAGFTQRTVARPNPILAVALPSMPNEITVNHRWGPGRRQGTASDTARLSDIAEPSDTALGLAIGVKPARKATGFARDSGGKAHQS